MVCSTRVGAAALVLAACSPSPLPEVSVGTTGGTSHHDEASVGSTTGPNRVPGSSTEVGTSGSSPTSSFGTGPSSTDSSSDSSGGDSSTGAVDPVQDAIEGGIAVASSIGDDQLVMQLFLDVMHRRHGVREFSTAAARYDELVSASPDPPIDAIAFRRIHDASQELTAEQLAQIAPGVNEVTVPALFCDTLPLPPDYGARLEADAALGGYELTHVVIALRLMLELDCVAPVSSGFVEQVIVDDFALIDPSDGLTDLEFEAAAFGMMLAGPELLPPEMLEATLAAQLDDGSWPTLPSQAEGSWHATGVALMFLLELTREPQDGFLAQHTDGE